nr:hypothetical protein P5627_12970 [Bacillus safensis]
MAPDIDPSVWEALQQYPFEGNVQELKNIVHYAAVIAYSRLHGIFTSFTAICVSTSSLSRKRKKGRTPAHTNGKTRVCFLAGSH